MEKNLVEKTHMTRREILGGVAVVGAAVAASGALCASQALASPEEGVEPVREGVQYGFLVKTDNCIDCKKCVEACKSHNGTAGGEARRKVTPYTSSYGKKIYISTGCMHCEDPACMSVCPAGAISKRGDGIVVVDSDRCIGCKYCYQACPFSVPHYDEEGMDKCDCCLGAGIEAGDQPYCAQACLFGALHYGTLDELSKMNHRTALRIEASTKPSYLVL